MYLNIHHSIGVQEAPIMDTKHSQLQLKVVVHVLIHTNVYKYRVIIKDIMWFGTGSIIGIYTGISISLI